MGSVTTRVTFGFDTGAEAAAATLDRDTEGLVFRDDFNRADSDTPGNNWVETHRDWDIASNRLVCTNAAALAGGNAYIEQRGETIGEAFVQVDIVIDDAADEEAAINIRWSGTRNAGNRNGFQFDVRPHNGDLRLVSFSDDSPTNLQVPSHNVGNGTHPTQFYVANGVQEGWTDGVSATGASAAHDDVNGRHTGLFAGANTTADHAIPFDDYILCSSKALTVTGLSTGDTVEVENSGGSVVASATESGGSASVDLSRHGGATEVVPFGGWAAVVVKDSGGTEQARFDSAGVYPGDAYTFSA